MHVAGTKKPPSGNSRRGGAAQAAFEELPSQEGAGVSSANTAARHTAFAARSLLDGPRAAYAAGRHADRVEAKCGGSADFATAATAARTKNHFGAERAGATGWSAACGRARANCWHRLGQCVFDGRTGIASAFARKTGAGGGAHHLAAPQVVDQLQHSACASPASLVTTGHCACVPAGTHGLGSARTGLTGNRFGESSQVSASGSAAADSHARKIRAQGRHPWSCGCV